MGFFAFSLKEMIESTANVFKILQFVMGGIGCVALLIAAVGIANTLIMSIYERTKEIGIIKVVGASIPDIRNLFLLEAGFIGFMGGIWRPLRVAGRVASQFRRRRLPFAKRGR